jgi:hypothetical protein
MFAPCTVWTPGWSIPTHRTREGFTYSTSVYPTQDEIDEISRTDQPLTPEQQKELLRTHSSDPMGLLDVTNMEFNRHELELLDQALCTALASGHALISREELFGLYGRIGRIVDQLHNPSSSQKSNVYNPARS